MTQALKKCSKLPCRGSTEPRTLNLGYNESRKNACHPGVFNNNLHSVEPNLFEEKSSIYIKGQDLWLSRHFGIFMFETDIRIG